MIANLNTILAFSKAVITPVLDLFWNLVNTNWEVQDTNWED